MTPARQARPARRVVEVARRWGQSPGVADSWPPRRFIDAYWPLIGGSFAIADVAVLWPKRLTERLVALGPLTADDGESAHRALAGAFPPA